MEKLHEAGRSMERAKAVLKAARELGSHAFGMQVTEQVRKRCVERAEADLLQATEVFFQELDAWGKLERQRIMKEEDLAE